ncbi:MAG: hypothetical protein IT323_07705 [Anaerolineae bacterium]|nr:hypothetical protein [Anaerolineae bacterium]
MDVQGIIAQVLPVIQQVIASLTKKSDAGIVGRILEAGSLATFVSEAAEKYKGNPVVDGIAKMFAEGPINEPDIDPNKLDVGSVLNQVANLDGVLAGLGGDTARGVKEFIYGMAEKVAGASGGGLFGSGQKVSADEAGFLNDLRARLGL